MGRRNVSPPTTLPPVEERLVRQRLRTIIQLAITIGRREGLISGGVSAEGDCPNHAGQSYAPASKEIKAQDFFQKNPPTSRSSSRKSRQTDTKQS